jgi:isochorismate pyruvate lyase
MEAIKQSQRIIEPLQCKNMQEVRCGVDAVDQQLVELLAKRFAYMDAAARIKEDRDSVRDEARKAQVIANVRKAALEQRLPQELIEAIWEALVEGSIAYEFERWNALRS